MNVNRIAKNGFGLNICSYAQNVIEKRAGRRIDKVNKALNFLKDSQVGDEIIISIHPVKYGGSSRRLKARINHNYAIYTFKENYFSSLFFSPLRFIKRAYKVAENIVKNSQK